MWEYTWTTAIIPLLPAENDHLSFLDDVVYIKSKFSGKAMFARPVDQTCYKETKSIGNDACPDTVCMTS